jgi:hypothetical protein
MDNSSDTNTSTSTVVTVRTARPRGQSGARRQGRYWILTIPEGGFEPRLPNGVQLIKGQLEEGGNTGYRHWQIFLILEKKGSCNTIRTLFGPQAHAELTRSGAAETYVWKEETAIPETQFQFGNKAFLRNRYFYALIQSKTDWDDVWDYATKGDLLSIPANIRVSHYRTIRAIRSDYASPAGMERTCYVFWGKTGTGKSRRAWQEAGLDAYPKDPNTKFWCGYKGQEHVVIDEFRGAISVSHLLRWLDRYPVMVEIKGSSVAFNANKIWITSNIDPRSWYPDLDLETYQALLRRLTITHYVI